MYKKICSAYFLKIYKYTLLSNCSEERKLSCKIQKSICSEFYTWIKKSILSLKYNATLLISVVKD